ncbi:hypothetical protein D0N50_10130 [Erwinia billingiae]|nr:hypothetical protein D0N50_10130 [Erwinia billingiae]
MERVSEQSFSVALNAILKMHNDDHAEAMTNVAKNWVREYESGLPRLTAHQYEKLKQVIDS